MTNSDLLEALSQIKEMCKNRNTCEGCLFFNRSDLKETRDSDEMNGCGLVDSLVWDEKRQKAVALMRPELWRLEVLPITEETPEY